MGTGCEALCVGCVEGRLTHVTSIARRLKRGVRRIALQGRWPFIKYDCAGRLWVEGNGYADVVEACTKARVGFVTTGQLCVVQLNIQRVLRFPMTAHGIVLRIGGGECMV